MKGLYFSINISIIFLDLKAKMLILHSARHLVQAELYFIQPIQLHLAIWMEDFSIL